MTISPSRFERRYGELTAFLDAPVPHRCRTGASTGARHYPLPFRRGSQLSGPGLSFTTVERRSVYETLRRGRLHRSCTDLPRDRHRVPHPRRPLPESVTVAWFPLPVAGA